MTYNGQDQERFSYRTALEALRNGVPNRAAVKILGSNQAHAEAEFQALLDDTADSFPCVFRQVVSERAPLVL